MPALHIQFSAQGKQPDGKVVNLPPSIALASKGPEVQISVTIADQIAQQLIIQGKQIPPPKAGAAIIDTGASMTCLDEEIAKELQLPVVNVVNLSSASHASTKANVYPIRIQIAGLALAINAMAIGAPLAAQNIIALIGRDILSQCTLFYNGFMGEITLSV